MEKNSFHILPTNSDSPDICGNCDEKAKDNHVPGQNFEGQIPAKEVDHGTHEDAAHRQAAQEEEFHPEKNSKQ